MRVIFTRLLCLALLAVAPLVHAWDRPEMAKYGAAYVGPELLHVYVAHTKTDDHAVIKIHGINHPLDDHVFWVKINYLQKSANAVHISYTNEHAREEHQRAVLYVNGSSATLYLPNYRGKILAEIPLSYSSRESMETLPEHLLTDYERQIGETP